MNSIVVVFFLVMIIIRTLRCYIAGYNTDEEWEESIEETGWKLLHGNIFGLPISSGGGMFLAIGFGVQDFCIMFIVPSLP